MPLSLRALIYPIFPMMAATSHAKAGEGNGNGDYSEPLSWVKTLGPKPFDVTLNNQTRYSITTSSSKIKTVSSLQVKAWNKKIEFSKMESTASWSDQNLLKGNVTFYMFGFLVKKKRLEVKEDGSHEPLKYSVEYGFDNEHKMLFFPVKEDVTLTAELHFPWKASSTAEQILVFEASPEVLTYAKGQAEINFKVFSTGIEGKLVLFRNLSHMVASMEISETTEVCGQLTLQNHFEALKAHMYKYFYALEEKNSTLMKETNGFSLHNSTQQKQCQPVT